MNRRRFLELLASTAVTSGVAYSFPSVIVPRNITTPDNYPPPPCGNFLVTGDLIAYLEQPVNFYDSGGVPIIRPSTGQLFYISVPTTIRDGLITVPSVELIRRG